ncbi:hypothetical protein [Crocosphaera sp. Alani8]|uniref:hypothetical protein n=1 Tax=Crocosphaera sp. Alani8 TaxID=3038952 RepID=UPI00313EEF63
MFLLIGVSLVSLVLLFLIIDLKTEDVRVSLLGSLVIWGILLTFIIELLSLINAVTLSGVFINWLIVDGVLIGIYQKTRKKHPERTPWKLNQWTKNPFSVTLSIGLVVLALIVAVVALIYAPNHSDSMEYHLSRVVHWIQNQSVTHYPTSDLFQLYQPPWAEFAIMNFQILSGGDRFAGLIQWGSMIGSWIGISLIAKELGASPRGQILAAIVAATVPMGILQGSSTDNNYVVTFWLVCFAYYTLTIFKEGITKMNILLLGGSLGLAILTKGTAYIYAFPVAIWLGLWGIKHLRWKVWQPIFIVLVIVLLINGGHYLRNIALFASPLGAAAEKQTLGVFSPSVFIANSVKQLSLHSDIIRYLHLESIITPLTGITNKVIEIIHNLLSLDINDPLLNSPKSAKFYVPGLSTYEDTAGNPFHLMLIGLATLFYIVNKKLWRQPYLLGYLAVVFAGIFLFFGLFTWSPYRCRLHLPFFILSSAFVGVVFGKSFNSKITYVLAVLILLLSYPWLFFNDTRPLIVENGVLSQPRVEHYFITQKQYQSPYLNVSNKLQSYECSNIGLIMRGTSFEYPLWRILQLSQKPITIGHINVINESAKLASQSPHKDFKPCIILSSVRFNPNEESKNSLTYNGKTYTQDWVEPWDGNRGEVTLFTLQDR